LLPAMVRLLLPAPGLTSIVPAFISCDPDTLSVPSNTVIPLPPPTCRLSTLALAVERVTGYCQLSRPRYARCVGGAAARLGKSFARLLRCPL
jgi:hypothetical protein